MRGSVKIRPIKAAEFDSKYTIGYEISNNVLMDNLNTYEMYCIKNKKGNIRLIRKHISKEIQRNFWTPDYCFIGSLLSQEDSVSLKQLSLMLTGDKQKMKAKDISKNFNKTIPILNKNYSYHYQATTTKKAVIIYLKGVKFVASVLYHYEHLKRVGDIEEFLTLQSIMNESGMAGLINDNVISLMAGYKQCYHFNYLVHESDFVVTNKNKLPLAINADIGFYEDVFSTSSNASPKSNVPETTLPPVVKNTNLQSDSKESVSSITNEVSNIVNISTEQKEQVVSEGLPNRTTVNNKEDFTDDKDEKSKIDSSAVMVVPPKKSVGWRDLLNNKGISSVDGREIKTPSSVNKKEEVISEDYVETGAYLQEIYQTKQGDE